MSVEYINMENKLAANRKQNARLVFARFFKTKQKNDCHYKVKR